MIPITHSCPSYPRFIPFVMVLLGPEDFGKLPFWAHLLPTALAQFHTILAMIVFSNGPLHILGLCNDLNGSGNEFGVLWWPVAGSRCEG